MRAALHSRGKTSKVEHLEQRLRDGHQQGLDELWRTGACGNVCKQVANAVSPSCVNGKCGEPVCKAGWANCDENWENGCETPTSEDAANCGACSNVCTQYPNAVTPCRSGTCDYGSIVCKPGFNNCNSPVMAPDGCETENTSDVDNCGGCGYVCEQVANALPPSCVNGKCEEPVCAPGWANCDENWANGCETATSGDAANCGRCGNVCAQYPNAAIFGCGYGSCEIRNACQPGFNNCNNPFMDADGCETPNTSDFNNCGGCGYICNPGEVCDNGSCRAG